MRWSNIKSFSCPQCAGVLSKGIKYVVCLGCKKGGFMVSNDKFDLLIDKMNNKEKPSTIQDNQEALNNIGMDEEEPSDIDEESINY